jgi:hypothetical protein
VVDGSPGTSCTIRRWLWRGGGADFKPEQARACVARVGRGRRRIRRVDREGGADWLDDAKGEGPALRRERGPAGAFDLHVGAGDHRPPHARLAVEGGKLVLHAHAEIGLEGDAAARGRELTGVDRREIDDGAAVLVQHQRRVTVDALLLAVDLQDVVTGRAEAKHVPPLGVLRLAPEFDAFRFERMVVLHAEIVGPPDAARVHDEGADVHVRVVHRR